MATGEERTNPTLGRSGVIHLPQIDEQECLGTLSELLKIDSQTNTPGEQKMIAWMVDYMKTLGLDAQAMPIGGGRANAVGIWRGTGEGPSLLFNGHVDTNPVGTNWTRDPWGGDVDERFIYGLGVSNMKAGCASYLEAVATLVSHGFRPRGDVILTFVVGELQGGVGTVKLIEDGVRADYFINCEPTDLVALTAHSGAFEFYIEITGETRHMSKREEGSDALQAACMLAPLLNDLGPGGNAAADDDARMRRTHIGVLRGGLGREFAEWRPPLVADFAILRGTCRYAPGDEPDQILREIEQILAQVSARYGVQAKLIIEPGELNSIPMPPFEVEPSTEIVRHLNDAYQDVRGVAQISGCHAPYSYYGTDAAHLLHRVGMQGIVCGPGGRYNTMPDERVDIVDYLDMIKIHMRLIRSTCGLERHRG